MIYCSRCPPKIRSDPGIVELQRLLITAPVDIVHLIYRQRAYERESKDYEFSRASVLEHWGAGHDDMRDSLDHPRLAETLRARRWGEYV